jgi:hypothetical protein
MEHKHDPSKLFICYFSDNLFNGYQVCIEVEKLGTIPTEPDLLKQMIIDYCYNELNTYLKFGKLEKLQSELQHKKNLFHIHQNITPNHPIYICCH